MLFTPNLVAKWVRQHPIHDGKFKPYSHLVSHSIPSLHGAVASQKLFSEELLAEEGLVCDLEIYLPEAPCSFPICYAHGVPKSAGAYGW